MKKEFSFYEFVGILVPGVTLLFFSELIFELVSAKTLIDFSKVGESIVFLVIAYGIGHILQAVGNVFESVFWTLFNGMPSKWLTRKNRFGSSLLSTEQTEKVRKKLVEQFGENNGQDYGRDVYTWLSLQGTITEKRIDVFNANYSLFRGLAVTFYALSLITGIHLGWKLMLVPFFLGLFSNFRMYRFAKLYASEVYRTYLHFGTK